MVTWYIIIPIKINHIVQKYDIIISTKKRHVKINHNVY